jgi:hypothetical protein
MSVERFITEARAVAQLQHPGIVQIFDSVNTAACHTFHSSLSTETT